MGMWTWNRLYSTAFLRLPGSNHNGKSECYPTTTLCAYRGPGSWIIPSQQVACMWSNDLLLLEKNLILSLSSLVTKALLWMYIPCQAVSKLSLSLSISAKSFEMNCESSSITALSSWVLSISWHECSCPCVRMVTHTTWYTYSHACLPTHTTRMKHNIIHKPWLPPPGTMTHISQLSI